MPTHPHGEALLAWLVFSDGQGAKRRPVLVVHDFGDDDLLVAPITSQPARVAADVTLSDWQGRGIETAFRGSHRKAGDYCEVMCGTKTRHASGQRTGAGKGNSGDRFQTNSWLIASPTPKRSAR
jgi:hypothetical protein